jgi:U3 small nucleolar RNA-associated protein 11
VEKLAEMGVVVNPQASGSGNGRKGKGKAKAVQGGHVVFADGREACKLFNLEVHAEDGGADVLVDEYEDAPLASAVEEAEAEEVDLGWETVVSKGKRKKPTVEPVTKPVQTPEEMAEESRVSIPGNSNVCSPI